MFYPEPLNSSLRFLFLLYHYPPPLGISTNRNYRIASEISKKADFSLIFTSSNAKSNDLALIQIIPTFDYRQLVKKKNKSGSISDKNKKSVWFQRMIKLMNTFPFSILISEGGPVYLVNVVLKGSKAIRKNHITHLYSSFRPFADHFAAFILKGMYPEVYWIADFRDLPVDPFFNHIYFKGIQKKIFRRVFKRANLLTTVSDGLALQLKEYNNKVIALKNGITDFPADFIPVASPLFTIVYTGSMYLDKKNALPLFRSLKELIEEKKIEKEKTNIIYAGKDSFYWKDMASLFDFNSMLEVKGNLSVEEVMQLQKKACINLLLTISSDELTGILTGKMIEYFESGSPVLAIVVNQIDPELENYLQELQIGKSFSDRDNDLSGIKEFILQEYLLWQKSGMNRKPVNVEVLKNKYSADATMKPLFDLIGL